MRELELHKIYRVIPDTDAAQDGDVRIIDESGEDYSFPATYFVPINVPEVEPMPLTEAEIDALWERLPAGTPLSQIVIEDREERY